MNSAEIIPLSQYVEKAYLDYSMYVILDRALPHIGDGLKPVQRRIVYAMSELGLKATAKPKKSARTIGDVLGKFHPHGDTACYEALVLMAQPFSYRYPLIEGQGNFGSPDDPKSFAAMRYTESRLSAYADLLLAELNAGAVEWVPNFDGTLYEPLLLPAQLPNVLLNGATGIAVGMATDIPPHNLREVVNALIHLLQHPRASLEEIMQFIVAPDFPTAAEIITSAADIQTLYRTGNGSIRARAVYQVEEDGIVVTALPYQVSGAKILEQIAQQMQDKKLPLVADLRDESDHEHPTRLVIIPRSNRVDVDALMHHLFATTDLERNYRVNLNMIGINGRPQVKPLVQILNEWLTYRTAAVKKRLEHRLNAISERLHILAGLLIVYLNLDEVIRIIRHEDDARQHLMDRFNLSDVQVDAILDTRLRHLARLEEMQIQTEEAKLAKEAAELEKILNSESRLKTLLANELRALDKQCGDARRSPVAIRQEAQALKETEIVPAEPMTVILSTKGWIRAAKGHEIDASQLSYKAGDALHTSVMGRSNQQVIFLDSTGRTYALPVHTLPSARGQGEPLTSRLTPPPGATFVSALIGEPETLYVLASNAAYGFITTLENLQSKNRVGKAMLTVPDEAQALPALRINDIDSDYLAAVSNTGHLLICALGDLPRLDKGKGNKLMNLAAGEKLVAIVVIQAAQSLIIMQGNGKELRLKPAEWQAYISERARRGLLLPRNARAVVTMRGE